MTTSENQLPLPVAAAYNYYDELARRAPEFEAAQQLPDDLAQRFAKDGFYHLLVPEEYGGGEVHPWTVIQVLAALGEGDGSAAWCVMIGATTGLLAASLPDEWAREIYGDAPGTITCGVTAPLGKAIPVEGGHQVTGRWPFGSSSKNADWVCGGAFIIENGEPRKNKYNQPENQLMMFRRSEITIEDTWHVSGLKGTGSHHFHVEDVFVPEGRSVVLGGRARVQRPLYAFPMLGLLALGVSSVALGIGRRAINEFKALATDKVPTGSVRSLANRPVAQADLARAEASLRSARALMNESVSAAWEMANSGERLTVEMKADLRMAAVNTTECAVDVVDKMYTAAGSSSIYENNALQRCFRDVHIVTQHLMVARPIWEVVGRVQLGMEPKSLL